MLRFIIGFISGGLIGASLMSFFNYREFNKYENQKKEKLTNPKDALNKTQSQQE